MNGSGIIRTGREITLHVARYSYPQYWKPTQSFDAQIETNIQFDVQFQTDIISSDLDDM